MNHSGADIPVIGLGAWPIGGGMGNMERIEKILQDTPNGF